jgi:hypothetical protein
VSLGTPAKCQVAERFKIYTSSLNVILLNHHLVLEETLPFWNALPHRAAASSTQEVDGVLGCSEERMVSLRLRCRNRCGSSP